MFIELIQGQRKGDETRQADARITVRVEAIVAVLDSPNRRHCLIQVFGAPNPYVSLETADAFLARLKEVDRNE